MAAAPASAAVATAAPTLAGVPTTATLAAAVPPVGAAADGVAEPDGSLYTTTGSWSPIRPLAHPVVGWTARPGGGDWEVATDGGIFTRGSAPFYGSTGALHLARPVVGMASTPTGHGYWLVASDGGIFTFGNAGFHGSTGYMRLARPVVGMASTPSGHGYWLVASDGGIFTFGDAGFHGSTGYMRLAQPIVGMASTPTGHGYWLVAADGGVFTFGDARFLGSGAHREGAPARSVAAVGTGYDVSFANGAIWSFRAGLAPVRHAVYVPAAEQAAARTVAAASTTAAATKAVSVALSEVGKPYVYGAAGPNAFDCSGLTQYAYRAAGVALPRTAAEQYGATRRIAVSQMRPGDLLFFYAGVTHVGMYIGNGKMVDAPHPGGAVRVEAWAYFGPLVGVGRPA